MKITYLEHQLENLIESAMIFGLPAPARADLDSCRSEIKLIKVQLLCMLKLIEMFQI